jgi:hypothetical protein
MVFVYGTSGTKEENDWAMAKAKYDAEMWYYRANGSVDIIADINFKPAHYPDRGIIVYGNANTNCAWTELLSECPIQVRKGSIMFGSKEITGDNYGAYLMYPRRDSKVASVAAIAGTGMRGMHAADANQYFAGGSGFPDYLIFSSEMMRDGIKGILQAGFFDNNWKLTKAVY